MPAAPPRINMPRRIPYRPALRWRQATAGQPRIRQAGGRAYRIADLKAALRSNQAYFASPLIKPLARRGAERALARALGRV